MKELDVLKSCCKTEYDTLTEVILCEPRHMNISNLINETQKYFIEKGFDVSLAMEQHSHFVRVLQEHGVNTIMLPPDSQFPEQVFTRDIGFTLGETVFLSSMATVIRQGEELILKDFLFEKELPYIEMTYGHIEGGDVIVDRDTVYIGVSERTDLQSITQLQTKLPEHTVIPLPFSGEFLHLDCVFNVLSEDEALIYPSAFHKTELELLSARYDLIEVSAEEQFHLATNVLSIGDRRIISLPVNMGVNQELRLRGYEVIEVEFGEIIKSGGSFRCCTLPIKRI